MAALTVFITTIAVTLLIHLVPGDPVQIMYAQSQGTTPEQIEAIRHNLGLDQPIYIQYVLDAGAYGVIVPMVETGEQAAQAVAACRYAPDGIRSFGALRGGADPNALDAQQYDIRIKAFRLK